MTAKEEFYSNFSTSRKSDTHDTVMLFLDKNKNLIGYDIAPTTIEFKFSDISAFVYASFNFIESNPKNWFDLDTYKIMYDYGVRYIYLKRIIKDQTLFLVDTVRERIYYMENVGLIDIPDVEIMFNPFKANLGVLELIVKRDTKVESISLEK